MPLYMYACAYDVTSGEQRPIVLPSTIGMKFLAIIAMVAIAVGLPPAVCTWSGP